MSEEEPEVIEEIPYLVPVGPSTVKTVHGSYVRTWRMSGVPWLTATDSEKNATHVELRKVLDSLTTEHVVYSVHLVRGEIPVPQSAVFPEGSFAAELAGAYRQSLFERRVYVNALYLSVEYLPRGRKAKRLFSFRGKDAKEEAENKDANAVFDAISLSLEHNLARYSPTPLSIYRLADRTFSQQLEFYAFLINGDRRRVPLTNGNLQETMLTSRTLFAGETGELRSPATTYYVAALGVKDYPSPIKPGQLNVIYGLPTEFVLTQTYAPLSRSVAMERARTAVRRDREVESAAKSEQEEIEAGGEGTLLDDLQSSRYGLGEYHFVLQLRARTPQTLNRAVAGAIPPLDEVGVRCSREDLGLEAAYVSSLPGQDPLYRPRPDTLTSGNAAGMMALIGEWQGKPTGNKWGEALAILRTVFGEMHYFNLHVKDVGHTLLLGPTGAGKTTVQLFIAAMLSRFGVKQVFFDYGRGSEVFCYAMGGKFINFTMGKPTGFNPFHMDETPTNILFATTLVKRLALKTGGAMTQHHETQLERAVEMVFRLPKEIRRLARVLDYVDHSDREGIAKRLARWIEGGPMGWLWDNAVDTIDFERTITGFNIQHFIDNEEIRGEVMMYLFHRLGDIIGKGRVAVSLGEFWKALDDPHFSGWVEKFLSTARKDDAIFIAEAVSPQKVAESGIAHAIIGQTATKIFLWNREADRVTYIEKFGLSESEYGWVCNLGVGRMLVKQRDGTSVILDLNLGSPLLRSHLAVLSGTTEAAQEVEQLRREFGDDPSAWRPVWNKRKGFN